PGEQQFNSVLGVAPVPPGATLLPRALLEFTNELRAVRREFCANVGDGLLETRGRTSSSMSIAPIRHAPAKQFAVGYGDERGLVRPVLGELAAPPQMV